MSRLIKINILIFLILLLFMELFLISLNFFFSGVPIYQQFNISEKEVVSHKQKKYLNNKLVNLDDAYIKSFTNFDMESYLEFYIQENELIDQEIKYLNGTDINFPYFIDKNNCRENKDENYIFSDTVLIGDSSLFGWAIASPYDMVGKLRKMNPNKKFLNLGMPGTGPVNQVSHLKKVTKETDFENLVWFFVEANDYEKTSPDADCYTADHNPKTLFNNYQNTYDALLGIKIFLAEHLRGFASFAKLFINYEDKFNLDKKLYEDTVKKLNIYLETKKVKNKILYYLPYYNRHAYNSDFFIHPNVKKLNSLKDDVRQIVIKHGFQFIDGDDAVKEIKSKVNLYHYAYPTHYNSKGYGLTAKHLSTYLEK